MTGPLVLVGGGEWTDGCSFDQPLLEASGGTDVLVVPTASAYEHPARLVDAATAWFAGFGGTVTGLDVLGRTDALDADIAAIARRASFIYLAGTSSMHLRSVFKDSPVWDAIVAAWTDGATLAGTSAAAMAFCDPMVDPRGGAFTLGLGVVNGLTAVPHFDTWSADKADRTRQLAPKGLTLVGIDERTALIRATDGTWRAEGAGSVAAWRDGTQLELMDLG